MEKTMSESVSEMRALNKELVGIQGEGKPEGTEKRIIEILSLADRHVNEAMQYYSKLIPLYNKLVEERDDLKPVAISEVLECIANQVKSLGDTKQCSVEIHNSSMKFARNHNVSIFCCNGK